MLTSPQEILVLVQESPSAWLSTSHITRGLIAAYRKLPRDEFRVRILRVPRHMDEGPFLKKAFNSLRSKTLCQIVLLDHHLPHASLIGLLSKFSPSPLEFFIHLYPDAFMMPQKWLRIAALTKGLPTRFFCGSLRHVNLMNVFFATGSCERIRYPVEDFFFDTKPIAPPTRTHIYAGRFTAQKNVKTLVQVFAQAHAMDADLQLRLAGWASEDRNHYFSKEDPKKQAREFAKQMHLAKGYAQDLGFLSQRRLRSLYGRAERVVSFSTFLFEDYGMSLAQAFACGTPGVITDWGGHGEFLSLPGVVGLPVELVKGVPRLAASAETLFLEALDKPPTLDTRRHLQAAARKCFSTDAVARDLKKALNRPLRPFAGAHKALQDYTDRYAKTDGQIFKDDATYARRLLRHYL